MHACMRESFVELWANVSKLSIVRDLASRTDVAECLGSRSGMLYG